MSVLSNINPFTFKEQPGRLKLALFTILPVIFAQILQRLYPVVDNHFVAKLGDQALLIHNIQFSIIYFGQYIGGATATSCLIFWKRNENANKQQSVFYLHLGLCALISVACMLLGLVYSDQILSHFAVQASYHHLAATYLRIGLLNMVLQAVYLALIGVVIAIGSERLTLMFAFVLLSCNALLDYIGVHLLYAGIATPAHVYWPMLAIGLSTTIMLAIGIIITVYILSKNSSGWGLPNLREILRVWFNELGGAFISGFYPIIYVFQLGAVKTHGSLLVTYQLLMQLTAIFCIPLLATMQVALRDASDARENRSPSATLPFWAQELLCFGLIPTTVLLLVFIFIPAWLIHLVFGYAVPAGHLSYIVIFLGASMLGQIGNALTVPIRAKKNSQFVTVSYFISDVVILLGGMQLTILFNVATPTTAGLVMLLYTVVYTATNAYFARK